VRGLPLREQLARVNRYGNDHPYVTDIDNYGREDYWAVPREFLPRGGDCEDFVLAKYFSLRLLGYGVDELRVVVVQDTNLRVPHAVLAVARGGDTWILDNQVQQVRSHRDIVHYAPVYSINDRQWWLHVPR
jgi:predicted transglutaminase-like cysteine proteinase